jgi:hypothetical protein
MSKASLELGGTNWGTKDGNLLAYAQGNESSKFVPREFTFTRGSDIAATRVNSSGSIEKYRENLLLQSNQFDTTWGSVNTTETSGQAGYDGSSDAWLLSITASGAYLYQDKAVSGVQTFSFFAKEGTLARVNVVVNASVNVTAQFDLANGIVLGGSQNITSSITSVGDGWYRCSVTYNQGTTSRFRLYPVNLAGGGTSGFIYIQDAQVEQGLVATSYLESGATTATSGVADNEPRIDYAGGTASLLLEPSRTNSWIHSEYLNYSFSQIVATTITQNTTETLSPEGLYNATKLEGIGSWIFKDFLAGTDTGTWTVSCWVKAVNPSSNNTFRLSVSGNNFSSNLTATNDWQKFSFSVTNGGATAAGLQRDTSANDADLYIYGLQVEAGSYATSYIPTYGTSVTRNGEGQSSSDFSAELSTPLSNAYTLFLDFEVTNNEDTSLNFADIFNFKFDELLSKDAVKIETYHIGGVDSIRVFVYKQSSGTQATSVAPNVIPMGSRVKLACVLDDSYGVKIFYNGTKIIDHQEITVYEQTKFLKGSGINGNIRSKTLLNKILAFPTALSDDECIALTTL